MANCEFRQKIQVTCDMYRISYDDDDDDDHDDDNE